MALQLNITLLDGTTRAFRFDHPRYQTVRDALTQVGAAASIPNIENDCALFYDNRFLRPEKTLAYVVAAFVCSCVGARAACLFCVKACLTP